VAADSYVLKTEALCWLRFGKKLDLVATEAGRWAADVLGCNDNFAVEVEVKMSKADLRREFSNKSTKHYLYVNAADGKGVPPGVPNYFYFFVPSDMEKDALALIEENAPKAGLAVYEEPERSRLDGKLTRVVRKAQKLHDQKPSSRFKRTLQLRMGSELCGRYVAFRDLRRDVMSTLAGLDDKVVTTMKEAMEKQDLEVQP
jgi:hypothetical protein